MSWLKKHLYFLPVLLFLPALGNFFSGDDWFHLRITQIDSLQQFLNFFSFNQNAQTASFYRPLSTQVFFFIFQSLFGLTAWPYYLFGLVLFAYSLHLVYVFSKQHLPSTINHLLTTLIYGLSVSNFTRLYFISAYQELFLVIFSLLVLTNFKSHPYRSVLFFILALLSKETAIVLPLLLFILNFKNFKETSSTIYDLRSTIFVSVIYLYFRLFHFGLVVGDSYLWNFSPTKIANTLMWYILWCFGAPELLVDYVSSGLRLIPRFFVDYVIWWPVIIFTLIVTLLTSAMLLIKNFKKLNSDFIKYILFFIITLLPVLFLPFHKFTLELGLPLIGFSLAIATLLPKKLNTLSFAFLGFYIFLNLSMNYLTYTRHYSVGRGEIAKKVSDYLTNNYPVYPDQGYFEFINDAQDNGEIWGQSKQISQALSSSDLFKTFYQNSSIEAYFQDIPSPRPIDKTAILVSTKQFLNQ